MEFIQNNLFLVIVAVVSGGMLLWPAIRGRAGGPAIGTAEATNLINREDALLVDVREADEWTVGHIVGAFPMALSELPERWRELPEIGRAHV